MMRTTHRKCRVVRRPARRRAGQAARERGSMSVELVILLPVLLLCLAAIGLGARIWTANLAVNSAATEAARTASIARTQPEAIRMATDGATATLANQDVGCLSTTVDVDTSGFAAPAGTPASVTARVTCVVNLAGLDLPGIPTRKTVTSTVTSPLDTYRER
ncbi:TadE/TadG family type IV pilus assembly protein [Promicromonospora sp. Marseille-Q5078]